MLSRTTVKLGGVAVIENMPGAPASPWANDVPPMPKMAWHPPPPTRHAMARKARPNIEGL